MQGRRKPLALASHLGLLLGVGCASAEPAPAASKVAHEPSVPSTKVDSEGSSYDSAPAPKLGRVGDDAHPFYARTINPEACGTRLVDLNKVFGAGPESKQAVVLAFAANYCEPCKAELAEYARSHQRLQRSGAYFVVVINDPEEAERTALAEYLRDELKLALPIVLDTPGGLLSRRYGVASLPHTVVVGKDGKIAWISSGYEGPSSLDTLIERVHGLP